LTNRIFEQILVESDNEDHSFHSFDLGFYVNPKLVNQDEQSLEFSPDNLKNIIDKAVAEGVDNDEGNWIVRKTTPLIKVWTRAVGSDINPNIPSLRVEHQFPEIDDPEIILKCLNEWRPDWDKSMETCEELPQYRSNSTMVHRLVNRSLFGASKREFIDKKVYFEEDGCIYMWVTSCPDEIYECLPPHIRSYSLVGVNKIGRNTQGGCYLHVIS
jgi:hypothetical protein